MNPSTRQHLMTVAAQRAQSHPAAVQRPLAQGSSRYRTRLWAFHCAVIILAALLLGTGLLVERAVNTSPEGIPPVTVPSPVAPPGPTGPRPTDPGEPPLMSIELVPRSVTMDLGERLPVQAWGTYNDGSKKQIPAAELSWDVHNTEEYLEVPDIASVDTTTGTDGIVIAGSAGEATLTATMQETENPKGTADITVMDDPGPRPTLLGPTDLQNPNPTASPIPVVP